MRDKMEFGNDIFEHYKKEGWRIEHQQAGSSLQLEPGVSQTEVGRELSGSGYKPEPARKAREPKKGGYPPLPPQRADFWKKEN
jgi:hypothetical protein